MKIFSKISLFVLFCFFSNILFAETVESSIGFVTDFEYQEEREKWQRNTGVFCPKCTNKWFFGS